MTLRIMGGQFRHRILQTAKGTDIRPSTGQLRAALFNICQTSIQGAHFLDIFAGSGAIGIEALSRGAASAVFIENSVAAAALIRRNIELLGIESLATLLVGDAFHLLPQLALKKKRFDLIFADPPYGQQKNGLPYSQHIVQLVGSLNLLEKRGQLFVEETHEAVYKEKTVEGLSLIHQRKYGRSGLQQWEPSL